MVATALVEVSRDVREAGWAFLNAIQSEGIECRGLYWAEFEENDWRFFVISDLASVIGMRAYREKLQPAVDTLSQEQQNVLYSYGLVPISDRDFRVQDVQRHYGSVPTDQRFMRRLALTSGEAYVFFLR